MNPTAYATEETTRETEYLFNEDLLIYEPVVCKNGHKIYKRLTATQTFVYNSVTKEWEHVTMCSDPKDTVYYCGCLNKNKPITYHDSKTFE